ncbi:MAG: hypothetical protein H5T86_16210, partial [Armatimonadetes bacterium]|nr:hypothetical protein [Armatimonadota bacterium]
MPLSLFIISPVRPRYAVEATASLLASPRNIWWMLALPLFAAQLILGMAAVAAGEKGLSADEAVHASYAAAIVHDLRHCDLRGFWLDIYDQGRWPPLGAVIQTPVLAIGGVNEPAHRIAMLVWLLPAGLLYAAAAAASTSRPMAAPIAAALTCLFLLTCRTALLTSFSVLYEIPGVAVMLAAYLTAAL